MVKGISRRVVVVDSPDPRIFEQAIFIVRNDALTGVSAQQVVDEACRVAAGYVHAHGAKSRFFRVLPAPVYALIGAGGIGLIWLLASVM